MASVTVTNVPTLVYESAHGTRNLPTKLIAVVTTAASTVYWGKNPATLTSSNGIPTETGDFFQDDDMRAGTSWYAVTASGSVNVNYETQGSK